MRILGPVVQVSAGPVPHVRQDFAPRHAVAAQPVPAMVATQSRFSFEVKLPIQWRRGRLRA
jgi:hypothetical protein